MAFLVICSLKWILMVIWLIIDFLKFSAHLSLEFPVQADFYYYIVRLMLNFPD